MPTGYTDRILKGCTFEEFVWGAARGMGALIMMRDDSMDAPIPERFEPSTSYYEQSLGRAKTDLVRFEKLSDEDFAEEAQADLEAARKEREEYVAKKTKDLELYKAMREKIEAWEPPSEIHEGFKEFMLEQISGSIKFDCGHMDDVVDESQYEPSLYRTRRIARAKRDIEYNTEQLAGELERTKDRNEWLSQLRDSVAVPEHLQPKK